MVTMIVFHLITLFFLVVIAAQPQISFGGTTASEPRNIETEGNIDQIGISEWGAWSECSESGGRHACSRTECLVKVLRIRGQACV